MSTNRATVTLLALGALALGSTACGGAEDQQIATRTAYLEDRAYEIVAEFPASVPRHEVEQYLLRVRVMPSSETIAQAPPAPIIDPIIEIVIGVEPHDEEEEDSSVAFFVAEPQPEPESEPEDTAPKDGEGIRPLDTHTKDIKPGNIKAATDPDVDPATPY